MPKDGQYGCIMQHVLKGLIKFVVLDGNMYDNFFLSVICICPMCTNDTNTVQWTLVWALIMPVAMKHWPHILKLVVFLFSPSNSLEIKGQKKKLNDILVFNRCLRPVKMIQRSYHPAFCKCQV